MRNRKYKVYSKKYRKIPSTFYFLLNYLDFSTGNNNTQSLMFTYHMFFMTFYFTMHTAITLLKADDKKHHFTESNLPALIYYKCKEWWSHYSMVLIANLVLQWSKALILTWYPEAKEQFYQDTQSIAQHIAVVSTLAEVKKNKDKQVIVIHDNDEQLCLEAIKTLTDIHERIIFIKNIDIFHKNLLNTCLKYNKLVLSGELDTCLAKGRISKKKYTSVILFSQPKTILPYTFVPLQQYTWYMRSNDKEWYVQSAW